MNLARGCSYETSAHYFSISYNKYRLNAINISIVPYTNKTFHCIILSLRMHEPVGFNAAHGIYGSEYSVGLAKANK